MCPLDIPRSSFVVYCRFLPESRNAPVLEAKWMVVGGVKKLRFTNFGQCVASAGHKFFIFDENFPGFLIFGMWTFVSSFSVIHA